MEHDFLTTKLLARRWKITPRTLERWRADGKGPRFLHIGRHIRYRQSDVLAFEARQGDVNTDQPTCQPDGWAA
jgi:helix-turn-helix protein